MYAFFYGKVDKIYNEKIFLEVNNIGYEIFMSKLDIDTLEINQQVRVYTYFQVKEDEMKLFGFLDENSLEFFKKLISVSGVGAKMAIGIISNVTASDMCVAIATENVAALKAIPGIGPKMAQKIIFELKDKVQKEDLENIKQGNKKAIKENNNIKEAIIALKVLGYKEYELKEVIEKLELQNDTVEEIIKKVLKCM